MSRFQRTHSGMAQNNRHMSAGLLGGFRLCGWMILVGFIELDAGETLVEFAAE